MDVTWLCEQPLTWQPAPTVENEKPNLSVYWPFFVVREPTSPLEEDDVTAYVPPLCGSVQDPDALPEMRALISVATAAQDVDAKATVTSLQAWMKASDPGQTSDPAAPATANATTAARSIPMTLLFWGWRGWMEWTAWRRLPTLWDTRMFTAA